ncbi:hypothetical protein P4S73_17445 [Paraglaciecola sp. Hal342]
MIANNNGPVLTALAAALCLVGCQQSNNDMSTVAAPSSVPSYLPQAPEGFEWVPIQACLMSLIHISSIAQNGAITLRLGRGDHRQSF